jgi:hypothetical protein
MNHLAQLSGTDLDIISGKTGLVWNPSAGFGPIVGGMLPYVFGGAGIALIFYIVFSGYAFMTSKGDPRAVEAAKTQLTYGITGFIIIFVAYWVVQILGTILGIRAINNIFS